MSRLLVIGDIHGYCQELQELLAIAHVTSDDTIVFLGDYGDRGVNTPGVIQTIIDLPCKHIDLLGNHDIWLRDWLNTGIRNKAWYDNDQVITQYINSGLDWNLHRDFLLNTKPYYEQDGYVFVHGGYTSRHGIGHEPFETNYSWDRTLVEIVISAQEIPHKLTHHREVFVGHSPTINYQIKSNGRIGDRMEGHPAITTPINKFNFWMLDTGICYEGKLTCMDVNTKQIWQTGK